MIFWQNCATLYSKSDGSVTAMEVFAWRTRLFLARNFLTQHPEVLKLGKVSFTIRKTPLIRSSSSTQEHDIFHVSPKSTSQAALQLSMDKRISFLVLVMAYLLGFQLFLEPSLATLVMHIEMPIAATLAPWYLAYNELAFCECEYSCLIGCEGLLFSYVV